MRWLLIVVLSCLLTACSDSVFKPNEEIPVQPMIRSDWIVEVLTDHSNDEREYVWSPDGEHIAYVAHHDGNPEVYVIRLDDRTPQNVSNSPADDYMPQFSPDGSMLAFVRRGSPETDTPDGALMLYNLATETLRIIHKGYVDQRLVKWSADNEQLVYQQDDAIAVYRISSERNETLVQHSYSNQAVSPDGRYVLCQQDRRDDTIQEYTAYLLDTLEGKIRSFVMDEGFAGFSWSPDSSAYALRVANQLIVRDARHETSLMVQQANEFSGQMPQWSHDGRYLASVFNDDGKGYLEVIDTRIGESVASTLLNHTIHEFLWSPTDLYLAFTTYAGLYVMDIETALFSNRVYDRGRLVTGSLNWSPDGKHLAMTIQDFRMIKEIQVETVVVNITSGELYVLASNRWQSRAAWSPDGYRLLVGLTEQWGNHDVMLVTLPDDGMN